MIQISGPLQSGLGVGRLARLAITPPSALTSTPLSSTRSTIGYSPRLGGCWRKRGFLITRPDWHGLCFRFLSQGRHIKLLIWKSMIWSGEGVLHRSNNIATCNGQESQSSFSVFSTSLVQNNPLSISRSCTPSPARPPSRLL